MARTAASLGEEARITDYISLGVITAAFPQKTIRSTLTQSGKSSIRERDLPAHVVMYYVIAQALFMQVSQREVLRCLLEGVRWLFGPKISIKVTGKSGISQARTRPRVGACQTTARRSRRADRGKEDARGLVQELEVSEHGRKHPGCSGYQREPRDFWAARREPRPQCLSADPVCIVGGERHPRAVWNRDGGLLHG